MTHKAAHRFAGLMLAILAAGVAWADGPESSAPRGAASAQQQQELSTATVTMQILQLEPQATRGRDGARGDAGVLRLIASQAIARQSAETGSEPQAPLTIVASELLLEVDDYKLTARDGELRTAPTSQADEAGGAPPWKLLAAPRMVVYLGQQASLTVGRQVPYMVAQDDGRLVVERSADVLEGVSVRTTVERADDGTLVLNDTRVKISRVTGRVPIENVPFDVGRPIITSRETSLSLKLEPEQTAVVRLPQPNESDPTILVFLSVKPGQP